MTLLADLEFRGLINQVTDQEGLEKKLIEDKITLYCGFDPTADSLHIGHLLPVLMLRRFQNHGHQPLALVGGATGLIGDPSGKANERTLNENEIVAQWSNKIKGQLSQFLDFNAKENPAKIVNNFDWIGSMDLITFLRDVGKYFGLNYMLAKESVSSRLENGISFTEFSYMILQSYDFYQLYKNSNCSLQVGGSDQWGNITSGLEFIRKNCGDEAKAFGLTIPLVTKSDGKKFGKTESGTIWLDSEKTTPYEFYQFWVNTDDRDVVKFLKYFTFLSKEEIENLEKEVEESPEKRNAQKALATEVTKLVHGEGSLNQAINITNALFNGDIGELNATEIEIGFKDVPSYECSEDVIGLLDLIVNSGVAQSKRQGREDITNGAIYVNGERAQDVNMVVGNDNKIEGKFTIIRRGKKKYYLIKWSK